LDDWVKVLEDTGWDGSGWVRPWASIAKHERFFLFCSVLMFLYPFVLSIMILFMPGGGVIVWTWVWHLSGNAMPILASFFTLYFLFHGVFGERYYELVCAILSQLFCAMLLFASAPYVSLISADLDDEMYITLQQNFTSRHWFCNIFICICVYCTLLLPFLICTYFLAISYKNNNHLLIRTLIDRKDLSSGAHTLFKYNAALILDLLISMSLTCCFVSMLAKFPRFSSEINILNVCCFMLGIPIIIIYVLVNRKMIQDENRTCFWFVLLLSFYEIVEMVLVLGSVTWVLERGYWQYGLSGLIRDCFVTACALSMRITLIYFMFQAKKTFGKGLSRLVFNEKEKPIDSRSTRNSYNSMLG